MSDKKTPPKTEKDSESTDIEPNIEEVGSSNVNKSDEMNPDSSEEIILDPLEEAIKEAAHWKDLAARNQAELDNYRKRMAREKSDAIKFANGSLLSELLPVIDSFQMGLTAAINEDPDSIISDVVAGMTSKDVHTISDRRSAITLALSEAREGDCVLLAGKGHELVQVVGKEKQAFDEREIILENLEILGGAA